MRLNASLGVRQRVVATTGNECLQKEGEGGVQGTEGQADLGPRSRCSGEDLGMSDIRASLQGADEGLGARPS